MPAVDRKSPWAVVYHQTRDSSAPALNFLDDCPGKLDAEFAAVLDAVAAAPPPQFSGGGKWEAMHGSLGGWHEIRLTGPSGEQFRLPCLLDNADDDELRKRGPTKPAIAGNHGHAQAVADQVLGGRLRRVRRLGDEHRANHPRRIAR